MKARSSAFPSFRWRPMGPRSVSYPVNKPWAPQSAFQNLSQFGGKASPEVLLAPIPKGQRFQCMLTRDKGAKLGIPAVFPTFWLHLQTQGGDMFLMAARARKKSKNVNIMISNDPQDLSTKSTGYVAKIKANWNYSEFVLYDSGTNPEKASPQEVGRLRQELGLCMRLPQVAGNSFANRPIRAVIPAVGPSGLAAVIQPKGAADTLQALVQSGDVADQDLSPDPPRYMNLLNKEPKLNVETQVRSLDFGGRVKERSSKNFQLVARGDDGTVLLQVGKVGKDEFILDFQHPFSPAQAFFFALVHFFFRGT